MRWAVRRRMSWVLLGLASLTSLATMGILIDEDELGGSLFLVGVLLFVAATVVHCRRRSRLFPLAICYAVGFALILVVILVAVTIGPHRAGAGGHWGWRDAAVTIGMTALMALATLIWCLGTDSFARAARWAAIPLLAGVTASLLPLPVIHDRSVAVAMVAALVAVVLCEVSPEAEEPRSTPEPVEAGMP